MKMTNISDPSTTKTILCQKDTGVIGKIYLVWIKASVEMFRGSSRRGDKLGVASSRLVAPRGSGLVAAGAREPRFRGTVRRMLTNLIVMYLFL